MRNDRHIAIELRRKGKSYKQISDELNIPKSTLHYWFKELGWSEEIKQELTKKAIRVSRKRISRVIKTNREKRQKWKKQLRKEARDEFLDLKSKPLFIAGVMLYWGEGDRNPKYPVRLSNIDHKMIMLFKKFLMQICQIKEEDIFLSLFLYPDLSEEKCKKYWSQAVNIKSEKFDKVQVISGRHPTKRLENGICAIRVKKSVGLKEKILVWIDLLSSNLVK